MEEVQFYKVKVLDAAFRERYGETVNLTLDKAKQWEAIGRGEILGPSALGGPYPLTTAEMLPGKTDRGYVTKTAQEPKGRFEDGD